MQGHLLNGLALVLLIFAGSIHLAAKAEPATAVATAMAVKTGADIVDGLFRESGPDLALTFGMANRALLVKTQDRLTSIENSLARIMEQVDQLPEEYREAARENVSYKIAVDLLSGIRTFLQRKARYEANLVDAGFWERRRLRKDWARDAFGFAEAIQTQINKLSVQQLYLSPNALSVVTASYTEMAIYQYVRAELGGRRLASRATIRQRANEHLKLYGRMLNKDVPYSLGNLELKLRGLLRDFEWLEVEERRLPAASPIHWAMACGVRYDITTRRVREAFDCSPYPLPTVMDRNMDMGSLREAAYGVNHFRGLQIAQICLRWKNKQVLDPPLEAIMYRAVLSPASSADGAVASPFAPPILSFEMQAAEAAVKSCPESAINSASADEIQKHLRDEFEPSKKEAEAAHRTLKLYYANGRLISSLRNAIKRTEALRKGKWNEFTLHDIDRGTMAEDLQRDFDALLAYEYQNDAANTDSLVDEMEAARSEINSLIAEQNEEIKAAFEEAAEAAETNARLDLIKTAANIALFATKHLADLSEDEKAALKAKAVVTAKELGRAPASVFSKVALPVYMLAEGLRVIQPFADTSKLNQLGSGLGDLKQSLAYSIEFGSSGIFDIYADDFGNVSAYPTGASVLSDGGKNLRLIETAEIQGKRGLLPWEDPDLL